MQSSLNKKTIHVKFDLSLFPEEERNHFITTLENKRLLEDKGLDDSKTTSSSESKSSQFTQFTFDASLLSEKEISEFNIKIRKQYDTVSSLLAKAQKGDAKAQFELATYYNRGGLDDESLCKKNNSLADKWYMEAARKGNTEAMYLLGEGSETAAESFKRSGDLEKALNYHQVALYWYRQAALGDHLEATHNLGDKYYEGEGTPKNIDRGIAYFNLAASKGCVLSQKKLVIHYRDKNQIDRAIYWAEKIINDTFSPEYDEYRNDALPEIKDLLKKLKEQQNPEEKQTRQGSGDVKLTGLSQLDQTNFLMDFSWFPKEDAAYLKTALIDPKEKDPKEILSLMIKAELENDALAQLELGKWYGENVKKSLAVKWCVKAANAGNEDAKNHLNELCCEKEWGEHFFEGRGGVEKDLSKAIELFTISANDDFYRAQYFLGRCYEEIGQINEALRWYQEAIKPGGIEKDEKEPNEDEYSKDMRKLHERIIKLEKVRSLLKNAEAGDPIAQFELGEFSNSTGNKTLAIHWFKQAAQQGHTNAMVRLGRYWEEQATHIGRNSIYHQTANEWYSKAKAAEQKHELPSKPFHLKTSGRK